MTHQPGDTINIDSYNNIVTQVNAIFGTGIGTSGYGGNSANVSIANLVLKSVGDTIDNQEWLDLRNAQANIADHQGVALPAALPLIINLENADIIQAFEDQTGPDNPAGEIDSAANLAAIVTNKDLSGGESFSVSTKLTSVRATSWSSFIEHEFHVIFTDTDAARHFFNTGGQVRIDASRIGGSATPQNTAWTNLLSVTNQLIFDVTDYFALTGAFVALRTVNDTGSYSANSWTISGKRDDAAGPNGGNGSVIRFKSSFLDGHANVFADTVDGTFTSTIDEKRSTDVFDKSSMTITYTTIIPLTSGS